MSEHAAATFSAGLDFPRPSVAKRSAASGWSGLTRQPISKSRRRCGAAPVVRVQAHHLLGHLVELFGVFRDVKDVVADVLAARVRAPRPDAHSLVDRGLVAHALQEEVRLRGGAVVEEDHDRPDAIPLAGVEVAVEPLEETLALVEPHLELEEETHRVEARLLRQRQLALRRREPLLETVFLPQVDEVHAVGRNEVDTADPRLGVVPRPRLLLRPRPRAPALAAERREHRACRSHDHSRRQAFSKEVSRMMMQHTLVPTQVDTRHLPECQHDAEVGALLDAGSTSGSSMPRVEGS